MNTRDVELSIDVMCAWGGYSPGYRIYVNDDLLTERTYVWDNSESFVREHIVINVAPGEHTLRLEKCGDKWIFGEYRLENLIVNGHPTQLVNNRFTITE